MLSAMWSYSFFFNDTATTEIYTLSLHDALPIFGSKELVALLPTLLGLRGAGTVLIPEVAYPTYEVGAVLAGLAVRRTDTRSEEHTSELSHANISYAVFCLKKKNKTSTGTCRATR